MGNEDSVIGLSRSLSRAGCNPQEWDGGTWTARCPVHGGNVLALMVRVVTDGSLLVRCRHTNPEGKPWSESQIWESLGLQQPQPKQALGRSAQHPGGGEPGTAASDGASGQIGEPARQAADPVATTVAKMPAPVLAEESDFAFPVAEPDIGPDIAAAPGETVLSQAKPNVACEMAVMADEAGLAQAPKKKSGTADLRFERRIW
jgi:hypothetical protein